MFERPTPLVQALYLLLVVGGYGAFLAAALPSEALGGAHVALSFAVVMAALLSFVSASTSPPGVLQPDSLAYFATYAFDGAVYAAGRTCAPCGVSKLARSKHCSVCDVCVPRFDHHCVWLNACVGEGNHVAFLRFLLANVVLTVYGAFALFAVLRREYAALLGAQFVHSATGVVVESDARLALQLLVSTEATGVALFLLCVVMGAALLGFAAFHCVLVATNTTTNEFFKRRRAPAPNAYDLGAPLANALEVWWPRYLAVARAARQQQQQQKIA